MAWPAKAFEAWIGLATSCRGDDPSLAELKRQPNDNGHGGSDIKPTGVDIISHLDWAIYCAFRKAR